MYTQEQVLELYKTKDGKTLYKEVGLQGLKDMRSAFTSKPLQYPDDPTSIYMSIKWFCDLKITGKTPQQYFKEKEERERQLEVDTLKKQLDETREELNKMRSAYFTKQDYCVDCNKQFSIKIENAKQTMFDNMIEVYQMINGKDIHTIEDTYKFAMEYIDMEYQFQEAGHSEMKHDFLPCFGNFNAAVNEIKQKYSNIDDELVQKFLSFAEKHKSLSFVNGKGVGLDLVKDTIDKFKNNELSGTDAMNSLIKK